MQTRLKPLLALGSALMIVGIVGCNGLRSGPLDEASVNPQGNDGGLTNADDAALGKGGDLDSGAAADGSALNAVVDPEWAMWRLPPINPPANNYASAQGIVLDQTTGLSWMQSSMNAMTHADAEDACATSTVGGGGWRLPTRIELLSLIDYSSLAINVDVFGPANDQPFWTSTVDAALKTRKWFVRFGPAEAMTEFEESLKNVRCVRGPKTLNPNDTSANAPAGHYVSNSLEVTLDVRTRLEWTRRPTASERVTLDGALTACSNLTLEGSRWRVPNERELETLVDPRAKDLPTWDSATFGKAPPSVGAGQPVAFWSLTLQPNPTPPFTHLGVDFRPSRSTTGLTGSSGLAFVRCVRGPK